MITGESSRFEDYNLPSDMYLKVGNTKVNNKDKKYKCTACGKCYKYNSGLWTHKKYECGKAPQFHCIVCNKSFTRKESLIQHSRMLHNQDVSFL